jgi:hypothetical protein
VNVANPTWKHPTIPTSPPVLNASHAMPVNQFHRQKKSKIIIIYVVYGIKVVEIPVGHLNKPCEWAFSATDYDEVAEVNYTNRKNPELRTHVPKDTMCSCYCDC